METRTIRNNNKGFSLLEVIISMAILAMITIPLLQYFNDSMKYNAMMEKKQQATIFAQELLEDLKSQEQPLIEKPSGSAVYTVPYLEGCGYTIAETSLDSEGKGSIRMKNAEQQMDVEVTLSTSVAANEVVRPMLYGLDDTTDVLAVEGGQTQEAAVYFAAINSSYALEHSTSLLSSSEIEKRMRREIHIQIERPGDYKVRVYAVYSCAGLRDGSSTDTFVSTDWLNVNISELKNIYLLYSKVTARDESGYSKGDTIVVERDASVPAGFSPDLFLICQKQDASTADPGYQVQVKGYGLTGTIHTNIQPADLTGTVVDDSFNLFANTKKLTEDEKPVRLVKIKVEAFPVNHSASDESYVSVETTREE